MTSHIYYLRSPAPTDGEYPIRGGQLHHLPDPNNNHCPLDIRNLGIFDMPNKKVLAYGRFVYPAKIPPKLIWRHELIPADATERATMFFYRIEGDTFDFTKAEEYRRIPIAYLWRLAEKGDLFAINTLLLDYPQHHPGHRVVATAKVQITTPYAEVESSDAPVYAIGLLQNATFEFAHPIRDSHATTTITLTDLEIIDVISSSKPDGPPVLRVDGENRPVASRVYPTEVAFDIKHPDGTTTRFENVYLFESDREHDGLWALTDMLTQQGMIRNVTLIRHKPRAD